MTWINTYTGKHFNYNDPRDFDIKDIAQALSNICRFTGHLGQFYSVAQHSVIASQIVPEHLAFEALMHDAHEAYVGDVNAPLKSLLPSYRSIERRVERALRTQFKLPLRMSADVKRADMVMLATERRDFGMDDGTPWPCLEGVEPLAQMITPLRPAAACSAFMFRYHELTLAKRWYHVDDKLPELLTKHYRVVTADGSEYLASYVNGVGWFDCNKPEPVDRCVRDVEWWCEE